MNLPRIYLIAILLLAFGVGANGQVFDDESNWFKEIGRGDDFYSRFDFTRYTPKDVQLAKDRYLKIASGVTNDEWAGSYARQTMLGRAEILWDGQNGFVYSYVYHTLANLDYGSVKSVDDSITFVSKRVLTGKQVRFFEGDHIKVKFGERHLLVPKSRLTDFAIWAVGREVPTGRRAKEIYTEEGFFWEKVDNGDKQVADVPEFPPRYSHLVKKPIQSKILSVGKLKIKREKSKDWGTESEERWRVITIAKGRSDGVRVGMTFWVDELEERIEIVSVGTSESIARLTWIVIDGDEFCRNDEVPDGERFPCRMPKVGMKVRTKTQYF